MILEEANKLIDEIKDKIGDNEIAHQYEDELYISFIKAIADNKYSSIDEIVIVAKEVVKVYDFDYERWYSYNWFNGWRFNLKV